MLHPVSRALTSDRSRCPDRSRKARDLGCRPVPAQQPGRSQPTGGSPDSAFTLKGSEVDYLALGTVRNTFTATATITADGSTQLTGHGTFRGGTGAYRGATGTYAFHASIAAGSSVLEGGSTGTLAY